MMKRLMMSVVCAVCAAVSFAAPKVRWIPANADIVAVSASNPEAVKAIEQIWRTTAKAHGVDFDELSAIGMQEFNDDAPNVMNVIMATLADSPTAQTATATSMVFSVTLPKSAAAFDATMGYKGVEDLGIYLFVENPKLNAAHLAQAVKDLAAANPDEIVLETAGAWTVLVDKQDADDIADKEPLLKIAYRLMDGGVIWTLGVEDHAMKVAEGILAGAAPALPKNTPYTVAFRDEITKSTTSAGCLIVKDVTELIKRYMEDEEYAAAMVEAPMLKGVGSIVITCEYEADGTIKMEVKVDMGSAANAEQLRDMALGLKAMMAMGLAQELQTVDDSAILALMSKVEISSRSKWLTVKCAVTPEQVFKLLEEVKKMNEATGCEYIDVEDDDDDIYEMDEDAADEILKSL